MPYNEALRKKLHIKRPQTIFILYWILLSYILVILVFWFKVLNKQNEQISRYRMDMVEVNDPFRGEKQHEIEYIRNRDKAQYMGEAITFLILLAAGAVIVFRAINRQLMQSQQQQNFMMAITHELKTPIAVTKLNLETLQKRVLSNEQRQKLIKTTIQEANRLNALCNNMLLTSQIEIGGYKIFKEDIDLVRVIQECVNDFMIRFPERKIEVRMPDEVIVRGDLLLLEIAVNNLLDNAIKYSRKDGIVLLEMYETTKDIHLIVIDEGPGVAKSDRRMIFQKYYRGSQGITKGTGLGLYLTKRIVETHNGHISLEANPGGGSIFEIVLKTQKHLFK